MTDYKQLCAELLAALESWSPNGGAPLEEGAEAIAEARLIERARAALSQPEPDVDDILQLAAIIRKVDGNNSLGAAALAEEILSHPHSRWTTDRAQRHPQPVPVSERPWERKGWCDEQGRCWALNEHLPAWEFLDCADSRKWADLFLPAHALPLPVEVGHD